jgi:hypothetical protein
MRTSFNVISLNTIKPVFFLFWAVCCFFELSLSEALAADRKVALIIGNSDYRYAPKLKNPLNDAEEIAQALRKINFSVIVANNLVKMAFDKKLSEFSHASAKSSISLVYYAGHGIQVKGKTYLIPPDVKLNSTKDIKNLIPAEYILNGAANAQKVAVVILDACRNNPFTRNLSEAIGASRSSPRGRGLKNRGLARVASVGRGLSRITDVPRNTLIAYATQAGNIALDGTGRNSPYASALVKYISTPNKDIRMVFGSIRDHVLNNTNSRQEPFTYGSLGGNPIYIYKTRETTKTDTSKVAFAVNPKLIHPSNILPIATNQTRPITSSYAAWQRAKQSNKWELIQQMVIDYPESQYGMIGGLLLQQKNQQKNLSVAQAIDGLARLKADLRVLPAKFVRIIQRKLREANYYSGRIDGRLGHSTKKALYAFIKDTYNSRNITYHSLLALGEIADLNTMSEHLSGTWKGRYYYPRPVKGIRNVDFAMDLVLSQGKISGNITEPNTFGNKTSNNLYANFHGSITGNKISWTKKYDGTAGVKHRVYYSGKLDRKRRRINGRWQIGPNWGGRFYIELD